MKVSHDITTAILTACRLKQTTQREVAASLGIDEGYFSKITAGKIIPNAVVAGQIAHALGLHVEDLWPPDQAYRYRGRPRKTIPAIP